VLAAERVLAALNVPFSSSVQAPATV